MIRSELLFQTPSWFIVFCFLAGVLYAFLLYKSKGPWGQRVNWALAGIRALSVGLIVFLLLNPLIRNISSQVQKAQIVLAVDNSASLGAYAKVIRALGDTLSQRLGKEGFTLRLESLGGNVAMVDSLRFDLPETDLSTFLGRMKKAYEGEHLTDIILISDGIVNQGSSPANQHYPFRVHALAVGDTTPVTDLRMQDVVHNKVAYLGNKFPIRAEVVAKGLAGKTATVYLKQGGKIIGTENIKIDRDVFFKSVNFETASNQKGMQRYTVSLAPIAGEHTTANNSRDVFVDIIDGRQRILLLAASPHPDLKAIKGIMQADDNYEINTHILSVNNVMPESSLPYDLVILHQVPNVMNLGNDLLRRFLDKRTPLLFILGNQSNIPAFNSINNGVQIDQSARQVDMVRGQYNSVFGQLNLSASELDILSKLPPLSVPFGDYTLRKGAEVVLFQKVGSLLTNKALLIVHTSNEWRTAILMGEGIWKWRQEEYVLTGKQTAVDGLLQKVAQLVSVKEDKRKFRVYSNKPTYMAGETVIFRTEAYNDVYELIYGQDVQLEVEDDQGLKKEYQYKHTAEADGYRISGLPAGAYRFNASSTIGGQRITASGQFIIEANDKEMALTTADFGMLRELSAQSGGQFVKIGALDELLKQLIEKRPADRLDATENLVELIRFKWLFFLIIGLLAIEWGLRKYLGGY